MFDIGFAEIIVISAVTLIVIGPKEIPTVVRGVVKGVRRLRQHVNEFQSGVSDFVDSTGVGDIKDDILKDDPKDDPFATGTDNWQDDFAVGGEEKVADKPAKKQKAKKSKAKKSKSKKSAPKKSSSKKSKAKKSKVKGAVS